MYCIRIQYILNIQEINITMWNHLYYNGGFYSYEPILSQHVLKCVTIFERQNGTLALIN